MLQKESDAVALSKVNFLEPNGLKLMRIFAGKIIKPWKMVKDKYRSTQLSVLCFN